MAKVVNRSKKTKSSVGKTGLQRALNNNWLVLGIVSAVVLVGVIIAGRSFASGCEHAQCWIPFNFQGTKSGSIVQKSNGVVYWDGSKGGGYQNSFYINSSVPDGSQYCVRGNGNVWLYMEVVVGGKVVKGAALKPANGTIGGCMYVPGLSSGARQIRVTAISNLTRYWQGSAQVFGMTRN